MKDVQCYELFGGIALKNHAFSFLNIQEPMAFYLARKSFMRFCLTKCTIRLLLELLKNIFMILHWLYFLRNINSYLLNS